MCFHSVMSAYDKLHYNLKAFTKILMKNVFVIWAVKG